MVSGPVAQLQETIARRWREIEQCFDTEAEWRSFSGELLPLLRQLDEPDDKVAEVTKRIEQLFSTSPAASELIKPGPAAPTSRARTGRGGRGRAG